MKRSDEAKLDSNATVNGKSAHDQRSEKTVKMEEEPVSSQEIVEFREQIAQLERDNQKAYRYAREFELELEASRNRVEFLENLLGKRPTEFDCTARKQVDLLQKKLQDVTKRFFEERRAHATFRSILTEKLEEEKARATADRTAFSARIHNMSLHHNIDLQRASDERMRDRAGFDELNFFRNEELRRINEERAADRARIEELMRKLALYEGTQQQPGSSVHNQSRLISRKSSIPHFPSIFMLFQFGSAQSISYDTASDGLRALYNTSDQEWCRRYEEAVHGERIRCATCNATFNSFRILLHFFSPDHASKMRRPKSFGAVKGNTSHCQFAVPLVAFEHWKRMLESIAGIPTDTNAAYRPTVPARPTVPFHPIVPACSTVPMFRYLPDDRTRVRAPRAAKRGPVLKKIKREEAVQAGEIWQDDQPPILFADVKEEELEEIKIEHFEE